MRRRIEELQARLDGNVGDTGNVGEEDEESEAELEVTEDHNNQGNGPGLRLIVFSKDRGDARIEVSCSNGSLKVDVMIDWIGKVERYFYFQRGEDPYRIKFAATKLKGYVAL